METASSSCDNISQVLDQRGAKGGGSPTGTHPPFREPVQSLHLEAIAVFQHPSNPGDRTSCWFVIAAFGDLAVRCFSIEEKQLASPFAPELLHKHTLQDRNQEECVQPNHPH